MKNLPSDHAMEIPMLPSSTFACKKAKEVSLQRDSRQEFVFKRRLDQGSQWLSLLSSTSAKESSLTSRRPSVSR